MPYISAAGVYRCNWPSCLKQPHLYPYSRANPSCTSPLSHNSHTLKPLVHIYFTVAPYSHSCWWCNYTNPILTNPNQSYTHLTLYSCSFGQLSCPWATGIESFCSISFTSPSKQSHQSFHHESKILVKMHDLNDKLHHHLILQL